MALEDDRELWLINKKTGDATQVSGNIHTTEKLKLIHHGLFIMMGNECSLLRVEQCGALFKICDSFLHLRTNTLLLHKRNEIDQFKRIGLEDFEKILSRKNKAAGRMISSLVKSKALIRPSKSYRFYVNPRFIIKGGWISCKEFHMLSMIDPKIRKCLDKFSEVGYKNWKLAMKEMGDL